MTQPSTLQPRHSGVYRTPPNAEALAAQFVAGGARRYSADFGAVKSKGDLLDTLARGLALPATFGRNWDALADSLQDLPLPPAGGVLRVDHAAAAERALGGEWSTFLEIVADAAMYWKQHGKPFVVFVDAAVTLPAWS